VQTVSKADTDTAVSSPTNPSVFGQNVIFTATVSARSPGQGTPTGTVSFTIDGTPAPSGTVALVNGTATYSTANLLDPLTVTGNPHHVLVHYNGDLNFKIGDAPDYSQTVT